LTASAPHDDDATYCVISDRRVGLFSTNSNFPFSIHNMVIGDSIILAMLIDFNI